jgi:hypothetical protein
MLSCQTEALVELHLVLALSVSGESWITILSPVLVL